MPNRAKVDMDSSPPLPQNEGPMLFLAAVFSTAPFPIVGAALVAFAALPPIVIATYALGSVILLLGLIVAFRRDIPRARGLDKFICLGPVLYGAPLAVFAGEHFTVTHAIASMVPHWIPWHMFWAWFVGVALLAAALSFAVGRVTGLAAALLGFMFLCFDLLMAWPGLIAKPGNRFVQALTLRELSFSACAFALASTFASGRWRPAADRLATAARGVLGFTFVFYGVQHFLHPQFVPVIPLEMPLPAWIPLHFLWAWGVGAALIAAGLAMLANWYARRAATLMGIVICVVVLLVYLPILIAHPVEIDIGMNYFADTLCFGGAVLCLAGSIPPDRRDAAALPEVTAAAAVHTTG
jgi:uncharacterized membrane protein